MVKKTSSEGDPKGKGRRKNSLFQKRQKQILTKAMQLFMEKGYARSSMREISRATGIDIRNLYYYIKNKEEILFLVFEMLHKPELELFEEGGILEMDDPVEQLRAVISGLVEIGYDYDEEILLLYRESKSLSKPLLKRILEKESMVVSHIEEILEKGRRRGAFDIEDTSFTANLIIYQLSLYALRNWNMKEYSKERLTELMERNIMKMVMA